MQNKLKLNSLFMLVLFFPFFVLPPITAAEQKYPSGGDCLQTISTKQKRKSPQFYFRSIFPHLSFDLNEKGHLVINTNAFLADLKSSTQNKLKSKRSKLLFSY